MENFKMTEYNLLGKTYGWNMYNINNVIFGRKTYTPDSRNELYFQECEVRVVIVLELNSENIKKQIDYFNKGFNKIEEISNNNIICWETYTTISRKLLKEIPVYQNKDKGLLKYVDKKENLFFIDDKPFEFEPVDVSYSIGRDEYGRGTGAQPTIENKSSATIFQPQFYKYYCMEKEENDNVNVYEIIFDKI